MKLTILSDIHEDIDRHYGYGGLEHDFSALKEQEFVIIAGDISGNPLNVKNFIEKNISNGVFVEGNHLGYSESGDIYLDYKQGANRFLSEEFNNNIKFLENDIYIKDDIFIIGCTLYTDFNLNGTVDISMGIAHSSMNDYNYVKCEHKGEIARLFPDKTVEWHNKSINHIDFWCNVAKEKYPELKVVVVTHHAPSEKSIGEEYRHSSLNPAYASDLEWLIEKYDNIRLWVHGHVHHDCDYKINNCRVICHPFGYYNQNNRNMKKFGQDSDCLGFVINTEEL